MFVALQEAKRAFVKNEVPVGCIIVYDGRIVGRGYNRREKYQCCLEHAELNAIKEASKKLNSWILEDCTMYVTLEPCAMCAGAILQSRIKRLVYAAPEPKHGAIESRINLLNPENGFNHQIEVSSGLMAEESATLLREFFQKLREKNE